MLNVGNDLTFHPGVPNLGTPAIYRSHEIFVNTSPSGMYDKTIFEAMASGTMIVTSNKNLSGIIGDTFMFKEGDAQGLSKTLAAVFGLSVAQKSLAAQSDA